MMRVNAQGVLVMAHRMVLDGGMTAMITYTFMPEECSDAPVPMDAPFAVNTDVLELET